jgi:hypothetical protein
MRRDGWSRESGLALGYLKPAQEHVLMTQEGFRRSWIGNELRHGLARCCPKTNEWSSISRFRPSNHAKCDQSLASGPIPLHSSRTLSSRSAAVVSSGDISASTRFMASMARGYDEFSRRVPHRVAPRQRTQRIHGPDRTGSQLGIAIPFSGRMVAAGVAGSDGVRNRLTDCRSE